MVHRVCGGQRLGQRHAVGGANHVQCSDTPLKLFVIKRCSEIPAWISVQLAPKMGDDALVDRPSRNPAGGLLWLAIVTRTDVAHAVRLSQSGHMTHTRGTGKQE